MREADRMHAFIETVGVDAGLVEQYGCKRQVYADRLAGCFRDGDVFESAAHGALRCGEGVSITRKTLNWIYSDREDLLMLHHATCQRSLTFAFVSQNVSNRRHRGR
jgi:hypothetical protein